MLLKWQIQMKRINNCDILYMCIYTIKLSTKFIYTFWQRTVYSLEQIIYLF